MSQYIFEYSQNIAQNITDYKKRSKAIEKKIKRSASLPATLHSFISPR